MAKRRGQAAQPGRDDRAGGARSLTAPASTVSSPATAAIDPKDPAADLLRRATAAFARGDSKSARALGREGLAAASTEPARTEARRLIANAGADPAALLAALAVFLTIAFAAWSALLHRH